MESNALVNKIKELNQENKGQWTFSNICVECFGWEKNPQFEI